MLRIILIALAIYCVFRLLRHYQTSFDNKNQSSSTSNSLEMVQCAHCGIHLPMNEGFFTQKKYFCCPEHAQLWQQNQTS